MNFTSTGSCKKNGGNTQETASFLLEPEDTYLGICAEIFFTRKKKLVFHCVVCYSSIHGSFPEIVQHFSEEHELNDLREASNTNQDNTSVAYQSESEIEKVDENEHLGNFDFFALHTTDESYKTPSQKKGCNPPLAKKNALRGEIYKEAVNSNISGAEGFRWDQTGRRERKCKKCDMKFPNRQTLNIHMKSHIMERKYKCEVCGKAFKESSNLQIHMRRHFGDKRYTCTLCPKKFHTNAELKLHLRCHNDERPFVCTECGRGFRQSGALTEHMRRHTNTRPYQCEVCNKSFYTCERLKRHSVVHTDERKYCCNICNAKFKMPGVLRQHMKIHENKREYCCHICTKAFNQRPALTSHLKGLHQIETANFTKSRL